MKQLTLFWHERLEMVKLSLVNLISHNWLSVFPYIKLIKSIANIRASTSL